MRCLDLRGADAFRSGHVAHAVHIDGLDALKSRFSTLPAPGVEFAVVCDGERAAEVARVFQPSGRWRIRLIGVGAGIATRAPAPPDVPHAITILAPHDFEAWARAHGGWRSGDRGADDEPALLFDPAPIVARATAHLLARAERAAILDVGCGAGRDLTYMLAQARAHGLEWRATALDRWRAALERAAQLLHDSGLGGRCDGIVCARVGDDGALGALPCGVYDVVMLVRFWHAALLARVPALVAPGGMVVLSHFVHRPHDAESAVVAPVTAEYDSPPPEARVQPGEIARLVASWNASGGTYTIVDARVEPVEDGRPVHSVIIRRSV